MSISDPKPKQMLPYVICVEGNIGSGKSTLLTNLGKSGFTVIEEPVSEIWGQYLPQLYEDIKRWGFCFQMEAIDWFRQLQSKKFAQILIQMKQQNGGYSLNNTPEPKRSNKDSEDVDEERMRMGMGVEAHSGFESEQKQESVEPSEQSTASISAQESDDEEDDDTDLEMDMNIDGDQENQSGAMNVMTTPQRKRKVNRRKSMSPQKQLLESSWVRQSKRVIIVERSALSCITIFAKNLMEQGNMTKWEYSLLKRFYSMIAWEPAHILYLRVDAQVCCRRIQQRNRKGEGNVDPDLISGLHEKHEVMFVDPDRDGCDMRERRVDDGDKIRASPRQNIIIVDGHKDADAVLREALMKISKIESRV